MPKRPFVHGFKHVPPARKRCWEPIITEMCGDWWPIKPKRIHTDTVRALESEGVAAFRDVAGILFGRLTPAGIALRDGWILTRAIKLGKESHPRTARRHSGWDGRGKRP